MSAFLVQKWEDIDTLPIAASTVVAVGDFLTFDGAGGVEPATAGDPIVGVSLLAITAADPDYADAKQLFYQKGGTFNQYKFVVPVGTGTATASMIGSPFDLTDAGSVDVSGSGTQVTITNVISEDLVEVTVGVPA